MPFAVDELQRGVAQWLRRWPGEDDFHAGFYNDLAHINEAGMFVPLWWEQILPRLGSWRAHRPKSYDYLTRRACRDGRGRLAAMAEAWGAIPPHVLGGNFDNVDDARVAITGLTTLASAIKNVASPVFCSKLCHFIAPNLFPVFDGAMTGFPAGAEYGPNWCYAWREWQATPLAVKHALCEGMEEELPDGPHEYFPMKSKVIEICLIGRHLG